MTKDTRRSAEAAGLAALSICEALALALVEDGRLAKEDLCGAIDDAIAAHRNAIDRASDPALYGESVRLAERVRRSIENVGS